MSSPENASAPDEGAQAASGGEPGNAGTQTYNTPSTPTKQAGVCPGCKIPVTVNADGSHVCGQCDTRWPSRDDLDRDLEQKARLAELIANAQKAAELARNNGSKPAEDQAADPFPPSDLAAATTGPSLRPVLPQSTPSPSAGESAPERNPQPETPRIDRALREDAQENEQTEQMILGAMMDDASCIKTVQGYLSAEDFSKPGHQHIFRAICSLKERGNDPDYRTVVDKLEDDGYLRMVGGATYVSSLRVSIPTSANVEYYAARVAEVSRKRRLDRISKNLTEDTDSGMSAAEAAEKARRDLDGINYQGQQKQMDARFKLARLGTLEISRPDYLIKRFLEIDELAQIFGDPGTAKSFLAIDMSCCIATGTVFHGIKVRKGPVVYIAGEGQRGIVRRFRAWQIRNQIDLSGAPLFISMRPAQLIDPDSITAVMEAIRSAAQEVGAPVLVVFDTLARNFGAGDENSTEDMSFAINGADRIRLTWKCAVLFVHHAGHADKTRSRGASALRGALDSEFRMDKDETGVIRLEAMKTKDGEPPKPMAFRIRQVEIGMKDEDGEEVTSAVLDQTDWQPKPVQGKAGRGKWQTVAIEALQNAIATHRENLEKDGRDPDTARVSISAWQEACQKMGMPRNRFHEVRDSLKTGGFVREEYDFVDLA